MTLLLTAVLLGIGFTFLAIQNTTTVDIQAGAFVIPQTPLYLIILAAFFFGIFISWIFGSISWISSNMTLHNKNNKIKEKNREIERLSTRLDELEHEKTNVKKGKESTVHDHKKHPNLVDRIRYNLS